MKKKILLVSPLPLGFELTQDEPFLKLAFRKAKAFMTPLAIATVAALTPDDFEVDLWDEALHGRIDGSTNLKSYDLVGVTGFVGHLPRAKIIAEICRKEGIPVVIGGSGVTRQPHFCLGAFDHLFLGEAETIWPKFLADWKVGRPQSVYRQVAGIDLAVTPAPRWDSIADQAHHYAFGAVQTSRGCPFDCEFCDVTIVLGSRYRCKPIDNVLQEVVNLEKLGLNTVIFCDDNFIGNPRYAKDLLRKLIPLNNSFRRPLRFGSEMSINMARDEEILELLADANFRELFVGIESPNKESLKEAGKFQNYRSNLVDDIRKIQSYGMPIRGALIVGFDHDKKDIFEQHIQFTRDAYLPVPSVRILMASPGTRLWMRFRKEGRLLKTDRDGRFFGNAGTTNIIPKGMTRAELQTGFLDLRERVYSWEEFALRVKGFVSNVKRRPNVPKGQGREWMFLLQFIGFMFSPLIDWKARRVILGILWYTRKQAPFMVPRVARIILRLFSYANTQELREVAQKQIDLEQSGAVKVECEQSESVIPEGFRIPYKDIFPVINREVCEYLKDKARSGEALIEIFTEFLRCWRPGDSFSAKHRSDLMELTRRTVSEKNDPNGSRPLGFSSFSTNTSTLELKKALLSEEILRAVEQELQMDGVREYIKEDHPVE